MTSKLQNLSLLLEQCSQVAELMQIHTQIIRNGLDQCFALVAKLLISCSFSQNITYASLIFNQIHKPNVFLCNTMLKSYSKSKNPALALLFYRRFYNQGLHPDHYTFSPLIEACKELHDLELGFQINCQIIKMGFESHVHTQTQVLRLLAECGSIACARQVFDEMPERDEVTWTAMISAYGLEHGDIHEANKLFQEMPFKRDGVSWNSMIVGFLRWGDILAARKLFDEYSDKNVISWSAMIGGHAQKGHYREALDLFKQMRLTVSKPNHITLVSALSSCSHLGSPRLGMCIHEYIEKHGIFLDVYLGTTLLDMYSKCGSIENAIKIFDSMHDRDVYSWTTMIEGLAIHGLGEKALEVFSKMQEQGVEPNEVTFVGIMNACCHMGLVKMGQIYFNCMVFEYNIVPRIEHYGCLVDLLGRAGLLDVAEMVVNSMPIKPNAVVWGALLGACKVRGNVELGERAIKHLVELEPENGGNYILLSNIYASTNRWDDVEKVRMMMRNPRVEKKHGFSSIEVYGLVYEFTQGDNSHPLSKEIYQLLDELAMKLKVMGHEPEIGEVLHDIGEEEKEYVLSWHSEKLAIAFGLLKTPPGSLITIMKNLRMCRDCHAVTKFISKIFGRKIVVRDRVRFHHFMGGECSCRDFW